MNNQIAEDFRVGRKWNEGEVTREQVDMFAMLVPEFISLVRGWFWEKRKRGSKLHKDSTLFFAAWVLVSFFVVLAYEHSDIFPFMGFVEKWGSLLLLGFFGAVGLVTIDSICRGLFIDRKLALLTQAQREDIARRMVALAYSIRSSEIIDDSLELHAIENGLKGKDVYSGVRLLVMELHECADQVFLDLQSDSFERQKKAIERLAGTRRLDLGGIMRTIRKELAASRKWVYEQIHEENLRCELVLFQNKYGKEGEV